MKVRVLLFARYKDLAGTGLLELDVAEGATAGQVFDRVADRFAEMKPMRGSTLMAVQAEYVKPGATLRDGDELALMPPLSGGR
ncbi:MAG: MoaD/ThiS family protein [Chloroflexota bacterium]